MQGKTVEKETKAKLSLENCLKIGFRGLSFQPLEISRFLNLEFLDILHCM